MTFFFETCVVGQRVDGVMSIALINTDPFRRENVLVLVCGPRAAQALCEGVGSALKDEMVQADAK